MKNLLKVSLAFMLLATFLVSCDKEIETTAVDINSFSTATIKGYVKAPLDLTKIGDEPVVGQKVIITMPYSYLGLDADGTLVDTVVTQSDGSFTYEVPVDANGVPEVTAKLADFIYDQVQEFDNQHATIAKVFYLVDPITFSNLKAHDLQVQKTTLAVRSTIGDDTNWYTVSGTLYCDRDQSAAGYEYVPSGTSVVFNCSGWSTSVTVGTDGTYTVSVPGGNYIYCDYNFTTSGKNSGGNNVTWRFHDSSGVTTASSDLKDQDVYLDDPTEE